MERYNVDITDLGKQDIRDIAAYISETLLEPTLAENTVESILDAIFSLDCMPARVPLVRDNRLAKMGIRGLFVKNYTVFFRINETIKNTEVIRILYSRRDWQAIL